MDAFNPLESLADVRREFGEHGGVNPSVEQSTTFTVLNPETMPQMFHGERGPNQGCYLYGRHFNPTVYMLARQLASLEGTEAAYCTASGMGAIAATLLHLCNTGDHIVSSRTVYGGTHALLADYLPAKANITTTFVNPDDEATVAAAFTDRTRVLYVESLSNPTLQVADIPRLARLAHDRGAVLVVDNTFSPFVLSPARLGADVVVHSLTKFVSGASDVIAGAICGSGELVAGLMDLNQGGLMLLGPTMDPGVAFQLSLRIPHLALRMTEHGHRALAFAERLESRGYRVIYPGLASHPHHRRLDELRNADYGYGGILGLDLLTSQRAERFLDLLQNRDRFGLIAVSLGYFDTLLSCSAESTSSELDEAAQAEAGISPGLIRISIGYTGSLRQRWAQFADALEQLETTDPDRMS